MLRPFLRSSLGNATRFLGTEASAISEEDAGAPRNLKRIGRALETYLRHSRENASMMARERADFDLGKRHLANMMGIDPHTINQNDIDKAIEYLFPSSLFDKKARPVMRPPDEILPRFNRFTFDDEGRPSDSRFYTLRPKFYALLSEIGLKTYNVSRLHAEHVKLNRKDDVNDQTVSLTGTTWINEEKMKKKLGENITTEMYAHLFLAFDYLVSLPGSVVESEFISQFREPLTSATASRIFGPEIPKVEICSKTNRRTATASVRVKSTNATVTVSDAGTGQWDIDGLTMHNFRSLLAREVLLCPLIVANLIGQVDVKATTVGAGGATAVPRAVRHGTALGLAALFPDVEEKLRLAGLISWDPRDKERNKVNQPGARAKWIWKRR
ncbi:unnamed protein product, partial [Mesorhabditis belari]|uniref:28S ribosomal protein S9, mitochondrial n=1 Tax=Mesorhabditis belari TaxID=2138241 RepID=A0AAF3E9Y3_9BILA